MLLYIRLLNSQGFQRPHQPQYQCKQNPSKQEYRVPEYECQIRHQTALRQVEQDYCLEQRLFL